MHSSYKCSMRLEVVEISTVSHCTVRCSYCPQAVLSYSHKHDIPAMPFETFKTIADKIYPVCKYLDFSGFTEPFLNPQCVDMILYANTKGFNLRLFTTLAAVSLKNIKRLRGIPFGHFCIHIPTATMNITVDKSYIDKFKWVVQSFDHTFVLLDGPPHPRLIAEFPPLLNYRNNIKVSRAGNIGKGGLSFLSSHHSAGATLSCLRNSYNHPVLMPDGTAALCCQDYGLRHITGNLLHESLDDFFNNSEYKHIINGLSGKLRNEILCNSCEYAVPCE